MVEYEPDIYYVEVIMGSRAMKGRPGTTISQKKTGFLMVITIIVAVIAALGFGAISVMNTWLEDLPDYADADAYNASLPTVVYASDGGVPAGVPRAGGHRPNQRLRSEGHCGH